MPNNETILKQIAQKTGPIPQVWANRYFSTNQKTSLTGLIYSRYCPDEWRGRIKRQKAAPWELWTALRALQLDTPTKILQAQIKLYPTGLLANINGENIGLAKRPQIQRSLRLGNTSDHWLTPGLTIEEEFALMQSDFITGQFFDQSPLKHAIELEATRARNWLDADTLLGSTLLLGPLSRRAFSRGERYRQMGFLNAKGELTKLGLWRLTTSAHQGLGKIDKLRQHRLAFRHRSWIHMRRVQQFVLEKYKKEQAIPLGVEYSLFSTLIKEFPHRYRPDAVMLSANNELIWYEYMRRPLREVKTLSAIKYQYLPADFLPMLSEIIDMPVIFIYQEPHVFTETPIQQISLPIF